jgi:hypothetical protein
VSSRASRLEKLEATLTAAPADRGSYCRVHGGLAGEDAILAQLTLEENGASTSRGDASAVYQALENGQATCRRCGS